MMLLTKINETQIYALYIYVQGVSGIEIQILKDYRIISIVGVLILESRARKKIDGRNRMVFVIVEFGELSGKGEMNVEYLYKCSIVSHGRLTNIVTST